MTDADLIARHLVTRGATVCPPACAAPIQGGFAVVKPVPTHVESRRKFNTSKVKSLEAINVRRASDREARLKLFAAEYDANPTVENVVAMAERHGVTEPTMRDYLCAAGRIPAKRKKGTK